jgi:peptide/nickel transport system substrate-binding protein
MCEVILTFREPFEGNAGTLEKQQRKWRKNRMKRRIVWTGLSFLFIAAFLVFALPLYAGGTTDATVEKQPVPGEPEPQYGGTLTAFIWGGDPPSADRLNGRWQTVEYSSPIEEYLTEGDFEKYGPRGTGEHNLFVASDHPEEFLTGALAESWEITADKVVFKIRPNVYWAAYGKEHVMESRELTAQDVVFSLNRTIDSPPMGNGTYRKENGGFIDSITAQDKYTVVVQTNEFYAGVLDLLGRNNYAGIVPPEYVEAGVSDWNNLVGTGPFLFEEFVEGSFMSYVRNPKYWNKATIDGKQYEIPFVDKFVMPIIPDQSSQIAALRTGKLDRHATVEPKFEESLAKTSPELIKSEWFQPLSTTIDLNLNNEYLSNREVRRALMVAIDQEAIVEAVMGVGSVYNFPISKLSGSAYTPIDELPPEIAMLFQYSPELAKKMLSDAGYPDGFKVDMICNTQQNGGQQPAVAEMVAAYWGEIGVEVEVKVMEPTAMSALLTSRKGYDTVTFAGNNSNPLITFQDFYLPDGQYNSVNYNNPYLIERFFEATQTVDTAARTDIFKEIGVIALDDLPKIPIGSPGRLDYWWPWVNNYYGELLGIFRSLGPIMAPVWIDQNLKKDMGYK